MTFLVFPVTVMLFLGGIYAWSLFVPGLQSDYGFTASQTQWVFGCVIIAFTTSMLIADKLLQRLGFNKLLGIAGALFCMGYLIASFSQGNFWIILSGIGIMSGIATGFGYMISLASAVQKLPQQKGLVTGIVSAGFGGGSVLLTFGGEYLLDHGHSVLQLFRYIGFVYGGVILLISVIMPGLRYQTKDETQKHMKPGAMLPIMFTCMLMGTFAGLMVIGNIKLMGQPSFTGHQLSLAIILFSMANFGGRLAWGAISDRISNVVLLPLALLIQGVATYLLGNTAVSIYAFYALVVLVGLGFASNFVLLAKEVAHVYGAHKLGQYYPYIFWGYGLAGVLGPVTGGYLFDRYQNFAFASDISLLISIVGGSLFLVTLWLKKRINQSI